jgi:hypothetical protein
MFILVALIGFGISVNAQTSSCKVEGIPGAYVNAKAYVSRTDVCVDAIAFGIESGSVQCIVKYTVGNNEQTCDDLIYLRKDKNGKVTGTLSCSAGLGQITVISVTIKNAVCLN